MRIFLDTSSLVKLYFPEEGSESIDSIFETEHIETVYLSDIARLEFASAIYKKVRTKDLSAGDADLLVRGFRADAVNYSFVSVSATVMALAEKMLAEYGRDGLRALDAIQLATAVHLRKDIARAYTSDNQLKGFLRAEKVSCG